MVQIIKIETKKLKKISIKIFKYFTKEKTMLQIYSKYNVIDKMYTINHIKIINRNFTVNLNRNDFLKMKKFFLENGLFINYFLDKNSIIHECINFPGKVIGMKQIKYNNFCFLHNYPVKDYTRLKNKIWLNDYFKSRSYFCYFIKLGKNNECLILERIYSDGTQSWPKTTKIVKTTFSDMDLENLIEKTIEKMQKIHSKIYKTEINILNFILNNYKEKS